MAGGLDNFALYPGHGDHLLGQARYLDANHHRNLHIKAHCFYCHPAIQDFRQAILTPA